MLSIVRMLCSLSASFIKITRGSSVRVRRIFLKFSACWEVLASITDDILVRPSTILVISGPNSRLISSSAISVSSTVSCNRAQMVLRIPRPISSTQILATANGCKMYGSPLLRRIVLCASAAISKAVRSKILSPGLSFVFKTRSNARYSRRISFFSSSSFKL